MKICWECSYLVKIGQEYRTVYVESRERLIRQICSFRCGVGEVTAFEKCSTAQVRRSSSVCRRPVGAMSSWTADLSRWERQAVPNACSLRIGPISWPAVSENNLRWVTSQKSGGFYNYIVDSSAKYVLFNSTSRPRGTHCCVSVATRNTFVLLTATRWWKGYK